MSVRDANPGDIYADANGRLWRVIWFCREPSVGVEAVEPTGYAPPPDGVDIETGLPLEGSFLRQRQSGGVDGLMWHGFKRIYRHKEAQEAAE